MATFNGRQTDGRAHLKKIRQPGPLCINWQGVLTFQEKEGCQDHCIMNFLKSSSIMQGHQLELVKDVLEKDNRLCGLSNRHCGVLEVVRNVQNVMQLIDVLHCHIPEFLVDHDHLLMRSFEKKELHNLPTSKSEGSCPSSQASIIFNEPVVGSAAAAKTWIGIGARSYNQVFSVMNKIIQEVD